VSISFLRSLRGGMMKGEGGGRIFKKLDDVLEAMDVCVSVTNISRRSGRPTG